MSEEHKEQTVAEKTDAPSPETKAEVADARTDDLDTLLAEYDTAAGDKGSKSEPERTGDDGNKDDGDVRKEIAALREEMGQREFKLDMNATVAEIRGDLDPEIFDDQMIEAWLDGRARQDTRLQQAWLDRHNNPQRFNRVKAELARTFHGRFSKLPNREVTEDTETVAAAVKGASATKAPEGKAPDYSRMSDQEYAKAVEEEYGFRPPL